MAIFTGQFPGTTLGGGLPLTSQGQFLGTTPQLAGSPLEVPQFQQLLQALLSALQQLESGFQGFAGQPQPFGGFGNPSGGFPQGYPQYPAEPAGLPPTGYGGYPTEPLGPPQPGFPLQPGQPVGTQNVDPAFAAGLGGNDAPLTGFGGGAIGQPGGTSLSGSLNTSGFNVQGNDAALGGGSGSNTVQGVQQAIAGGGGNALNNEPGPNNLGTFGDSTVPNGILNLNQAQISQVSHLSQTQLAALHLWGIQMTSAGKENGGILLNVLQDPKDFTTAEVQLAKQLYNEDMSKYGGVTGKSLDQAFFGVYKSITGQDISQQFANAPVHYATGPVNLQNRVQGTNGLNNFENSVMILWGHTALFGGGINGQLEGDILSSSKGNSSLGGLDLSSVQALAKSDVIQSGKLTGNSLNQAMISTLQNIYFGAPQATAQSTVTDALKAAAQTGKPIATGSQLNQEVDQAIAQTPKNLLAKIPGGVNIFDGNVQNCPYLNGGGG